jgi:hypothetical protein
MIPLSKHGEESDWDVTNEVDSAIQRGFRVFLLAGKIMHRYHIHSRI